MLDLVLFYSLFISLEKNQTMCKIKFFGVGLENILIFVPIIIFLLELYKVGGNFNRNLNGKNAADSTFLTLDSLKYSYMFIFFK